MSCFDFNSSKHIHCFHGLIIEFAALAPDKATAGTPMPLQQQQNIEKELTQNKINEKQTWKYSIPA